MRDRALRPVAIILDPAQAAPRPRCVGVQGHRTFQHDARGAVVAQNAVRRAKHGEDQRIFAAQFRRFLCVPQRVGARRVDIVRPVIDQALGVAPSRKRQRERILRIDCKCLIEKLQGLRTRISFQCPDLRHGAHGVVIGTQVLRPFASGALDFSKADRRRERAGDPLGNAILQVKHVFERTVDTVCPDMCAARHVNELHGDAHPAARLLDAALEHVANPQLPADLRHVDCTAFVAER